MFLINGDYRLDSPADYQYAGTTFKYTKTDALTEEISAEGPTNSDLYVKVKAAVNTTASICSIYLNPRKISRALKQYL